ncbi:MAG: hypothetical protein V2A54_06535 [Bacteroidota bacterium]
MYKKIQSLSPILNSIPSEAVQLRILELALQEIESPEAEVDLPVSKSVKKTIEKAPKKRGRPALAKTKKVEKVKKAVKLAKPAKAEKVVKVKKTAKTKLPPVIAKQIAETSNKKVAELLKKGAKKRKFRTNKNLRGSGNYRMHFRPLKTDK